MSELEIMDNESTESTESTVVEHDHIEGILCDFCNKYFKNSTVLSVHKKTARYCLKIQQDNSISDIVIRKFECDYCEKEFTTKLSFNRHISVCSSKEIFNEVQKQIVGKEKELTKHQNINKKLKSILEEKDKEMKIITENKNIEIINIMKTKEQEMGAKDQEIKLLKDQIMRYEKMFDLFNNKDIGEDTEINMLREQIVDNKIELEKTKKRKKNVPKALRMNVWKAHVGNNIIGKCYSCEREIQIDAFEAGHVIAEANGGRMCLDNLKPICKPCNTSCSTMNLDDFKNLMLNIEIMS